MTPLETANAVLDCFAQGTSISIRPKVGVVVSWSQSNGKQFSKRWMTRGQDFYPVWSQKWGHGGTACTALSQLVRWVKEQPVLPLGTWQYWTNPKCYLARARGPELVKLLEDGGYPTEAICVLCKKPIDGGMDWWSQKKVSGPCCGWTTGCRQETSPKQ